MCHHARHHGFHVQRSNAVPRNVCVCVCVCLQSGPQRSRRHLIPVLHIASVRPRHVQALAYQRKEPVQQDLGKHGGGL